MSQENVEIVRRAVEASNGATGDVALADPDVEWRRAQLSPTAFAGREGVAALRATGRSLRRVPR